MASLAVRDPNQLMAQHQEALRKYALRTVKSDEALPDYEEEEEDKALRMREFLAIGSTFGLSDKEMVVQLFRGLFSFKRGCDCPGCRTRRAA